MFKAHTVLEQDQSRRSGRDNSDESSQGPRKVIRLQVHASSALTASADSLSATISPNTADQNNKSGSKELVTVMAPPEAQSGNTVDQSAPEMTTKRYPARSGAAASK
jgi:hypothetical protein